MSLQLRRARVVVGVDDTLTGLAALRAAVAEARRRGAALYALRAVTMSLPDYDMENTVIADAFAHALGSIPADLEVHLCARPGGICHVLQAHATDPGDLIVVGTSGKGLWHAIATGSVAYSLLRHASCPVLAVPAPEMARTTRHLPRRALPGHDPLWEQFDRYGPGTHPGR